MFKTNTNDFLCMHISDSILALALHPIVEYECNHVLSSAVKLICGFERDWERRSLFGLFVGEVGDESSCQRVMTRFFAQETT